MTTPVINNTVRDIIKDAMLDAGLISLDREPDSVEYVNNFRRLCDLINIWQVEGLKLFVYEEMDVTLEEDEGSYTLDSPSQDVPTRHYNVISGRVVNTDNNTRVVDKLSREDYLRMSPESASPGAIVGFNVDRQHDSIIIRVYPMPDSTEAANTLKLLVQKQITNPSKLTESVQFPIEWRMALHWGLAAEISTTQPDAVINRCESRANKYKQILEDADIEDVPVRFVVDNRQSYGGGRFR